MASEVSYIGLDAPILPVKSVDMRYGECAFGVCHWGEPGGVAERVCVHEVVTKLEREVVLATGNNQKTQRTPIYAGS